jgi:hypothetical protein
MRDDERVGEGTPAEAQPYESPAIEDLKGSDAPVQTAPGAVPRGSQIP